MDLQLLGYFISGHLFEGFYNEFSSNMFGIDSCLRFQLGPALVARFPVIA